REPLKLPQFEFYTPLQLVQSSIEKKRVKAKELSKKTKGLRKKSWPQTWEGVQLLFAGTNLSCVVVWM
ncbi:hypothetical protein HID58_019055, partial [Brassica napus]